MLLWIPIVAAAAPEPPPPVEPPARVTELEGALAALQQALDAAKASLGERDARVAALQAQVTHGAVLLDHRRPASERAAAADALVTAGDPGAAWLLRAGAGDPDEIVALASVRAALVLVPLEGPDIATRVLLDPDASPEAQLAVVDALGAHRSREAAEVLYVTSGDRTVSARVRARAVDLLETTYADYDLGPRRDVVDPLGGVAFVTANGLAGGILLSSVGAFGRFDGAITIGAAGGGAIGVGSGVLYARSAPLTLGEGLVYASGVSWGLTYGLWTTTAAHGAWKWMPYDDDTRARTVEPAAAYRALGVTAGALVGGYILTTGRPEAWDVLEVDTAGYLGSAIALGTAGLAGYRPPPEFGSTTYTPSGGYTYDGSAQDEYREYRLRASQWLDGAQMFGAGVGLAAGIVAAPRWDLDWNDAAFGVVLGGEAAWVGQYLPDLLGIDDQDLKGTVRLPWNAGIGAGLVWSELHPVSLRRTAVTGWGAVTSNAIGGGLPLVLGESDSEVVARVLVPVGVAGTLGAFALDPVLQPSGGDAVMIGVGSATGTVEGLLVGLAVDDLDGWGRDGTLQAAGLTSLVGGVTGAGLLALSPLVDPSPDDMVVLGTAAAWGGYYGGMI
ncbi:MAG: hypothetical protein ABMA64_30810, partial [Myxococcota bacterium]